jgi:tRNA G10  N-methylase Trm11
MVAEAAKKSFRYGGDGNDGASGGGGGRGGGRGGSNSGSGRYRNGGNGGGNGDGRDGESFRVRFSRENVFEKVPRRVAELAEQMIINGSDMVVDRFRPKHEFWFIIRRDGAGYFCRLLKKRKSDGRLFADELRKGELRPELACLLCIDCEFSNSTVICDPFAGSGAIPAYIQRHCDYKRIYVSDIDAGLAAELKNTRLGRDSKIVIKRADAANLSHIRDGGVNLIVTDPPWGQFGGYRDIAGLYKRAFAEMARILADSGEIVLLSGAPAETASAASAASLRVVSKVNILVSGKKACVYTFEK